jgi:hypothetical protein
MLLTETRRGIGEPKFASTFASPVEQLATTPSSLIMRRRIQRRALLLC